MLWKFGLVEVGWSRRGVGVLKGWLSALVVQVRFHNEIRVLVKTYNHVDTNSFMFSFYTMVGFAG